jgi:hypothetical protein
VNSSSTTLQAPQELGLADAPELQLEQRVGAVARRRGRHRAPDLAEGDAEVLLDGGEGVEERRGEHAAEVGDERPQAARRGHRRRLGGGHARRRTS